MFSPEKPTALADLQHVYTDFFPLKCVFITTFASQLCLPCVCNANKASQHFRTCLKVFHKLEPASASVLPED